MSRKSVRARGDCSGRRSPAGADALEAQQPCHEPQLFAAPPLLAILMGGCKPFPSVPVRGLDGLNDSAAEN